MPLARADFDNPAVASAANPSSSHGYHHGPIPNNNPGWIPVRQAAAVAAGTRPPTITAADNANPPTDAVRMSSINTLVCDIDVNHGQMCGVIVSNQPSLRRHIRASHPGTLTNPSLSNTKVEEMVAGENAIKRFVLTRGWRNARYVVEPGRGLVGGYLDRYATACEEIARVDEDFATQFGTIFHRERVPVPTSSGRRKRGPTPPSPPSL